jgi:hypothetical protein
MSAPATPADDALRQFMDAEFDRHIRNELSLYQATGDARFVWRAIGRFDMAGRPLPAEFVRKLSVWGAKVQNLSDPKSIAAALELSGTGKSKVGPKHSAAFKKRWRLGSEVLTLMKLHPSLALGAAIKAVARNNALSVAKVKSAYHAVFTAPATEAQRQRAETAGSELHGVLSQWGR